MLRLPEHPGMGAQPEVGSDIVLLLGDPDDRDFHLGKLLRPQPRSDRDQILGEEDTERRDREPGRRREGRWMDSGDD